MKIGDLLVPLPSGGMELANREFIGEVFENLSEDFVGKGGVTLRNVSFTNCKTSPGTCNLYHWVTLSDVRFENLDCGDGIRIACGVRMTRVVVKGKKPAALRVWKERKQPLPEPHDAGWYLDVSEFQREVDIRGLPIGKVRYNPETQVAIEVTRFEAADWEAIGLDHVSRWRLAAFQAQANGCEGAVYSLPRPKDRNYARAIADLELLRRFGVVD